MLGPRASSACIVRIQPLDDMGRDSGACCWQPLAAFGCVSSQDISGASMPCSELSLQVMPGAKLWGQAARPGSACQLLALCWQRRHQLAAAVVPACIWTRAHACAARAGVVQQAAAGSRAASRHTCSEAASSTVTSPLAPAAYTMLPSLLSRPTAGAAGDSSRGVPAGGAAAAVGAPAACPAALPT